MIDPAQELRRNEKLRGQARVNPWKDVGELESVGETLLGSVDLFSFVLLLPRKDTTTVMQHDRMQDSTASMESSIRRLKEALHQVNVWKSRTHALPHAIESTAALAQIILRDVQPNIIESSTELRLAYSSAILRTINGLADVLQQQRVHAASVTVLCQQLGIPSWLVSIRHESTHQQLPSLAVLRLASKSLLHYFRHVYWDPLARAKLDQWNDANALLQKYHKAALQIVIAGEEEETIETAPESTSEPSEPSQDKKQHSQADEETQRKSRMMMMLLPFHQSKLGTSINSFAVLQSSSSKKNKEKRKRPKRKVAASKKAKRDDDAAADDEVKIVHVTSGKSTCPTLGQAFVKANVPLDIARYALLSYLIWKGPELEESSVGGVLLDVQDYEQHGVDDCFVLLKQRYLPLIQAACRAWPGFLTTVLVHIVDALLYMEEIEHESSSEDILTKTSLLEQWVRCLLSKESLLQMFPTLGPALKSYKLDAVIQWQSLLSLQLPLNSLCDRCEEEGSMDPSSSSHALARFFREMLGNDRVQHFGACWMQDDTIDDATVEHDNLICRNDEEKPTETDDVSPLPGGLSLEEMEKLLLGDKGETAQIEHPVVNNVVDRNMAVEQQRETIHSESNRIKANEPISRKCWVRCTNWDACAIGSLPGHPN